MASFKASISSSSGALSRFAESSIVAAPPQQESILKWVKTPMVPGYCLMASLTTISFVIFSVMVLALYEAAMASFRSFTIVSASRPCMVAPKAISSVFDPGQVKHPLPKCFMNTGSVAGNFSRTSPMVMLLVIVVSVMVLLLRNNYFAAGCGVGGAGAAFTVLNIFITKKMIESASTNEKKRCTALPLPLAMTAQPTAIPIRPTLARTR